MLNILSFFSNHINYHIKIGSIAKLTAISTKFDYFDLIKKFTLTLMFGKGMLSKNAYIIYINK